MKRPPWSVNDPITDGGLLGYDGHSFYVKESGRAPWQEARKIALSPRRVEALYGMMMQAVAHFDGLKPRPGLTFPSHREG